MTAEIINLRKARKAKTRSERESRAAENRTAFGRTKAERLRVEREKSKLARELDGKKVDPTTPEDNAT